MYLAANTRNFLTEIITKSGLEYLGRMWCLHHQVELVLGAGRWRRTPLESSKPWNPHICAHKGCDNEIILLLPQASHPQIPPIRSHFFYMFLARKCILRKENLKRKKNERKKNPLFALCNDTRYPANKNTNPEMDLVLFPHFSKYKVWIAAPNSHLERAAAQYWGLTQQGDDLLQQYLQTATWMGGFLAEMLHRGWSTWAAVWGQPRPATECFAASKLVRSFYWDNKQSKTSKELGSLRCLGRLGHQGDLQPGETCCWPQMFPLRLPTWPYFDHIPKVPTCILTNCLLKSNRQSESRGRAEQSYHLQ